MTELPETLECRTCGSTAHRCVWGATAHACYRCSGCHEGGEIRINGNEQTRIGGVFEPLQNQATRVVVGP